MGISRGHQLCLLLWKFCKLQTRWPMIVGSIAELVIPVSFAMLLVVARKELTIGRAFNVSAVYKDTKLFHSQTRQSEIFYWPNTSAVNEIMSRIPFVLYQLIIQEHYRGRWPSDRRRSNRSYSTFGYIEGYPTERRMIQAITSSNNSKAIGVVFTNVKDKTFPKNVKYKIRPRSQNNWYPALQFALTPIGVLDEPASRNYQQDFLILQIAMAISIIAQQTRQNWRELIKLNDITLTRIPYPPHIEEKNDILPVLVPVVLAISFMLIVMQVIRIIVYEREMRIKEAMKLVGLDTTVYWLSWFVRYVVAYFIPLVIAIAVIYTRVGLWSYRTYETFYGTVIKHIYYPPLFIRTSWSLMLVLLLLYGVSIMAYALMITTLFRRATKASMVGAVMFLLILIPAFMVSPSQLYSRAAVMASSLSMNSAICIALNMTYIYEKICNGAQWTNFMTPPFLDGNTSLAHIMLMLLLDSFIYLTILWYVDNVRPGEFGIPRPWNFPLTKTYWCGNNDIIADIRAPQVQKNTFEEEPNLKVGIAIKNLRKKYRGELKTVAVADMTMNVYEDQITVLLGHNGAGKTTAMSMITGFLAPTSGTALVNGHDINTDISAVRESLGLCPQHNILFDNLTVQEHLTFYTKLKGVPRDEVKIAVDTMLESIGMTSKQHKKAKSLSGGQKRKLSVGIALCGNSKVIVLDEPSSGMDPEARRELWDILVGMKSGRTILLSTHFMDEADFLGDRIAIMAQGVVKCCGSPLFLKSKYGAGYHLTIVKGANCQENQVTALIHSVISTAVLRSHVAAELKYTLHHNDKSYFQTLFSLLEEQKDYAGIASYGISETTMEDVFLKLGECSEATDANIVADDISDSVSPTTNTADDVVIDPISLLTNTRYNAEPAGIDPISLRNDHRPHGATGPISSVSETADHDNHDPISLTTIANGIVTDAIYTVTETVGESVADPTLPPKSGVTHINGAHVADTISLLPNTVSIDRFSPVTKTSQGIQHPCRRTISVQHSVPEGINDDKVNSELNNNSSNCEVSTVTIHSTEQQSVSPHIETCTPGLPITQTNIAFNLNLRKTTSIRLNLQQFNALIVKKGIHSWRNWWVSLCTALLPLLFASLALFGPNTRNNNVDDSTIPLNLDGYRQSFIPVGTDAYTYDIATLYERQFTTTEAKVITGSGKNFVLHYLANKSTSEDIVYYRSHYFVGAEFYGKYLSRINENMTYLKGYYSGEGIHLAAISLAYLINSLCQLTAGEDYSIETINEPIPTTLKEQNNETYVELLTSFVTANLIMSSGIILVSASYVIFVIKERTSGATLVQQSSGVPVWMYWATNFIWDFITFLIPCATMLVIPVVLETKAYLGSGLGLVYLVMVLYGWATIPWIYLFQFLFTTSAGGMTFVTIYGLIVGIGGTFLEKAVRLRPPDDYYGKAVENTLFITSPQYCLCKSMWNIILNHEYQECQNFNTEMCIYRLRGYKCCKINLDSDCDCYIEKYLASMFVQGVVFMLVTIIVDMGVFRYINCFNRNNSERRHGVSITYDDSDVKKESDRISVNREAVIQQNPIVIDKIYKKFGLFTAVNHISVAVPKGECFGLLGVNGAGKTTSFRMLIGDVRMADGEAFVNGCSVRSQLSKAQRDIGYCPQFDALIDQMTGREMLYMYARIRGIHHTEIPRVVEILEKELMLVEHANKQTHTYSGGNKRKLCTAIALIGDPSIVFLDEPTTGMDPAARRKLWNVLSEVRSSGRTLVFTSHSMEECDVLCTRIAIMVNGRFRCLGSPQHLKSKFGKGYTLTARVTCPVGVTSPDLSPVKAIIEENFPSSQLLSADHGHVSYRLSEPLAHIFGVVEDIRHECGIEDYSVSQTTLDRIFIELARSQGSHDAQKVRFWRRCFHVCY